MGTVKIRRICACIVALLAAACAMPPIDRYALEEARATPVRLEGARGPLSYAQSRAILAGLKSRSTETSIFDHHVAVEESIAGKPLSVGNQVVLLEDGEAAYPAMLEAIRSAKHHIHLEVYIFEESGIGHDFLDALIERAKAGVQVRVAYDSFGSKGTSREFFDLLKKGGVHLLEYSPVDAKNLLKKGPLINQRDHRKLLLVDARVAFLGGINISDVYAGSSGPHISDVPFHQRPWRDTQIRVEGPAVNDLQKIFVALWEREKKEKIPEAGLFPDQPTVGPHVVRALEGVIDQPINPLYVTFVSAISSAEAEVHITMAYFVPDARLLEELKAAARRGVAVKLILPSRSDGWVVFHAGRSFYDELLEAGVKIYERKNRLLHSKYAVIDGVWSTVGSSNLDWRSLLHNLELNVVILGPDFARRVNALFDKDLAMSEEITLERWRHRPLKDRAREAAARSWAYLL
jgi:cardiolipin synthase A/B